MLPEPSVGDVDVATPSIVAASTASANMPVPSQHWRMRSPDGQVYGPIDRRELNIWFGEGRIDADCQLLCDGSEHWIPAIEIYPELENSPAASAAPVDWPTTKRPILQEPAASPVAQLQQAPPPLPLGFGETVTETPFSTIIKPAVRGWIAVDVGLGVANVSLMVSVGCLAALIVAWTGLGSAGPALESAIEQRPNSVSVLSIVAVWSVLGLSAAAIALLTGWCVCLKVPKATGAHSFVVGAVACLAAALTLALLLSAALLGIAAALTSSDNVARLTASGTILICLLGEGSLVLFALFLAKVGAAFGDDSVARQSKWFAIVQFGVIAWFGVATFLVTGGEVAVFITKMAMSALIVLGDYYWLGHLVRRARRPLRLIQPVFEAQGALSVE